MKYLTAYILLLPLLLMGCQLTSDNKHEEEGFNTEFETGFGAKFTIHDPSNEEQISGYYRAAEAKPAGEDGMYGTGDDHILLYRKGDLFQSVVIGGIFSRGALETPTTDFEFVRPGPDQLWLTDDDRIGHRS